MHTGLMAHAAQVHGYMCKYTKESNGLGVCEGYGPVCLKVHARVTALYRECKDICANTQTRVLASKCVRGICPCIPRSACYGYGPIACTDMHANKKG